MKKILVAILVVSAIGATSCKKDNEVSPIKKENVIKVNDGGLKKDVGSYD